LRTPIRPFSRRQPSKVDVVHVQVLAGADRLHRAADVHAVLDDRLALLDGPDRQLVADRDVRLRVELDHLVLVHDPAGELRAGPQALHDHHADRIALVVDDEVDRHRAASSPARCAPAGP
jgi:hypothetical protein